MILDAEYHRAYFIYITPREVNSYWNKTQFKEELS
jgi:hypothetical protein